MAPNLATLPNEILWTILRNFCLHCTREYDYDAPDGYLRASEGGEQGHDNPSWYSHKHSQALYSMCLVSRRFLSVAQPLLHHDFIPGYGDSWRSNVFSWDRRLSSFLRTIARRRDLAALVRRIYVHPYLRRCIKPEEAHSALDDAGARALVNFNVAEYTAHFQAMLVEADDVQSDALGLLGVLLALVPNLDRLSLHVTRSAGDIPVRAFQALAQAIAGQTLLSRLQTLDICSHSEGSVLFSLDQHANGILRTAGRNLVALNLHMCGAATLRIEPDELHLRHLRITQSCLRDDDFGALVSACGAGLETFVYEASYPSMELASCVFELPTVDNRQPTDHLLRYLVKFEATLKLLHLDLRSRQYVSSLWDCGCTQPLTGTITLQGFRALEDVFMSACSICPETAPVKGDTELLTRSLPPNIRTLKLAGRVATTRLTNALSYLAEMAAQDDGRFATLERIRCDESMAQIVDEMAVPGLFDTAGVDFGYDTWPLSKATVPTGAILGRGPFGESYSTFPCVPLPMPPPDPDL